jgi:hypothetical protein
VNFSPGCPQTEILLISVSQVARITDKSSVPGLLVLSRSYQKVLKKGLQATTRTGPGS